MVLMPLIAVCRSDNRGRVGWFVNGLIGIGNASWETARDVCVISGNVRIVCRELIESALSDSDSIVVDIVLEDMVA